MDPIVLRFIERLVAVLVGALAIFLGYRLFRLVPEQRDSSGEVKMLLNTSITVTRVGPGVVFALFGILAIAFSLLRPMKISPAPPAGAVGTTPGVIYSRVHQVDKDAAARAKARASLQQDMAVLNNIPKQLREDLAPADRKKTLGGLTQVKLDLMESVWGTKQEGFGEFAAFEEWVQKGEKGPPPANMEGALRLYYSGLPGGPR